MDKERKPGEDALWSIGDAIEAQAKAIRELADAMDRLGARIENGLVKVAEAIRIHAEAGRAQDDRR